MNDRFKFRFWHKPTQKMIDCYGFNKDFVFGDTLDGVGTEYNPAKIKDCILMQCTGLKDKNGTLIYEGDIVTYDWLTPISRVWRNDAKHIVEWNDGFTVIGNIAEPMYEDYSKRWDDNISEGLEQILQKISEVGE